jgi:D-sedoheptulose 7-phosphate isomerase
MKQRLERYFTNLRDLPLAARITDRAGSEVTLECFFEQMIALFRATHEAGNKVMFVGNGGSSTIASHMAIDFSKNGNLRAICFTDAAALTCLGNDLGYENVYAKQIEMLGRPNDVLVAISSSGNSPNILNAAIAARMIEATVITLSGFAGNNKLRRLGDHNLYISDHSYGFVEVTHLAILHAILDIACGYGDVAERAEIAHRTQEFVVVDG